MRQGVLLLLALVSTVSDDSPELAGADLAYVTQVREVFSTNPELLRHHCGYIGFLKRHPAIADGEAAYSELSNLLAFREVTVEFDEALADNPDVQSKFDRYCEALAQDEAFRSTVNGLLRCQLDDWGKDKPVLRAIEQLLADVDRAIEFLRSPENTLLDSEPTLRPLRDAIENEPEFGESLLKPLLTLDAQFPERGDAFAWWEAVADADKDVSGSYRRLKSYLCRHKHQFWVWRRRQVLLAGQPHARNWIRYWRRSVRRVPKLAGCYDRYLRVLRERPDLNQGLCADHSDTEWPPEVEPPELAGSSVIPIVDVEDAATITKPVRPAKPVVEKPIPTKPRMPEMPSMPELPQKPKKQLREREND